MSWENLLPQAPASTPPYIAPDYYKPMTAADMANTRTAQIQNNLADLKLQQARDQGDIDDKMFDELMRLQRDKEAQTPQPQDQPQSFIGSSPGGGAGQSPVGPQMPAQGLERDPSGSVSPMMNFAAPGSPNQPTGPPQPLPGQPSPAGQPPMPGQTMNAAVPQPRPPQGVQPPAQGQPMSRNQTKGNFLAQQEWQKIQAAQQKAQMDMLNHALDTVTKAKKLGIFTKENWPKIQAWSPKLAGIRFEDIKVSNDVVTYAGPDGKPITFAQNPGEPGKYHYVKPGSTGGNTDFATFKAGVERQPDETDQQYNARVSKLAEERQVRMTGGKAGASESERLRANLEGVGAKIDPATGRIDMAEVPNQIKLTAKGVAEYKIALPSSYALTKPYWQSVLAVASEMNPNFDQTQYNVRMGIRKAFTSGKEAQNIVGLNTAVGHLETFMKASKELDNSNLTSANSVANLLSKYIPVTPSLVKRQGLITGVRTKFNATKGEMASIFKQSGATDQEIASWEKTIDDPATATPQMWKAFTDGALELMGSRMEARRSQYEIGMGEPKDFHFLNDKSRTILKGIGVDVDAWDPVTKRQTQGEGTPPSGYTNSGRKDRKGNEVWFSPDKSKAWIAG
jgi:hypothetical protein